MIVDYVQHDRMDYPVEILRPDEDHPGMADVAAGTLVTLHEDGAADRTPYRAARAPSVARTEATALGLPAPGAPRLRTHVSMATWCESCERYLPQRAELRGAFSDGELGLYGVPVDDEDTPARLAAYVRAHGPAYRLLDDAPLALRARMRDVVRAALGSDALPTTVISNAAGRVLEVVPGVPSVSRLRRWVRK